MKMAWADEIYANTLFVADLERAKLFYEKVFEKSPVYGDSVSAVYQFGAILINLLLESEAVNLITPAKIASPIGGSRFQLTIQVDDVDVQAKRFGELGISFVNGPMDRPWGIRTLLFADPDGNLWEFATEIIQ